MFIYSLPSSFYKVERVLVAKFSYKKVTNDLTKGTSRDISKVRKGGGHQ